MHTLNLDTRLKQSKEIVHQSMPPETILLNLDNGYYYSTNRIGSAVWEHCNGINTIEQIIESISKECGISPEVAKEDILGFVREMIKEGIVTAE